MDRLFILFKRYNTERNDLLSFQEYCSILCPVNERESEILRSRSQTGSLDLFEPHVVNNFLNVVLEAIQIEVNMEQIRQKLAGRKDFDIGKAFLTLAAEQRSDENIPTGLVRHIYPVDLVKLMKKHDRYDRLEQLDISLLMSRLDLDGDGRIGINEFYHQIEPQSDRKY